MPLQPSGPSSSLVCEGLWHPRAECTDAPSAGHGSGLRIPNCGSVTQLLIKTTKGLSDSWWLGQAAPRAPHSLPGDSGAAAQCSRCQMDFPGFLRPWLSLPLIAHACGFPGCRGTQAGAKCGNGAAESGWACGRHVSRPCPGCVATVWSPWLVGLRAW